MNNIKLFEYSLKNPEPIIDGAYVKNGSLIISKDPRNPSALMKANNELIESINAYKFAKNNGSKSTADKAIRKILEIVKNKNINFSEFVSFWSVVDMSYSLYKKRDFDEQFQIIKDVTDKYLQFRHGLYTTYGYSPTTLQVGKDAKAHKESGNLGIAKVSKILDDKGFHNANMENVDDFIANGDKKYIQADKKGKKLFKEFIVKYKIKFSWSRNKEEKMPDFLIKYGKHFFIVEHKHMKEGGGGQDKQINEVISFISFKETKQNIHYISFLDGLYFNLFADKKYFSKGKVFTQLNNIKNNLKSNKKNFFVNTKGFEKLFYHPA